MARQPSEETLMRKIRFSVTKNEDRGIITVRCLEPGCTWMTRAETLYGEGMAFANRRKREHRRDHIIDRAA
jgi:hypothetical protein